MFVHCHIGSYRKAAKVVTEMVLNGNFKASLLKPNARLNSKMAMWLSRQQTCYGSIQQLYVDVWHCLHP